MHSIKDFLFAEKFSKKAQKQPVGSKLFLIKTANSTNVDLEISAVVEWGQKVIVTLNNPSHNLLFHYFMWNAYLFEVLGFS